MEIGVCGNGTCAVPGWCGTRAGSFRDTQTFTLSLSTARDPSKPIEGLPVTEDPTSVDPIKLSRWISCVSLTTGTGNLDVSNSIVAFSHCCVGTVCSSVTLSASSVTDCTSSDCKTGKESPGIKSLNLLGEMTGSLNCMSTGDAVLDAGSSTIGVGFGLVVEYLFPLLFPRVGRVGVFFVNLTDFIHSIWAFDVDVVSFGINGGKSSDGASKVGITGGGTVAQEFCTAAENNILGRKTVSLVLTAGGGRGSKSPSTAWRRMLYPIAFPNSILS